MFNQRSGRMPFAGALLAAVIVIVGIGIAMYLMSDVYRTKVNAALDQFAHWTPENIAADPLNYLNFCEEKNKQALKDFKTANCRFNLVDKSLKYRKRATRAS